MLFGAGGLFAILLFAFWIWAILDVITSDRKAVRILPKLLWLFIVVVLAAIGAALWMLFGRPFSRTWRPGGGEENKDALVRRRPIAPEDEPRFIAAPTAMTDRRSAELDRQLDEWEAEQRRIQGQDTPDPGDTA